VSESNAHSGGQSSASCPWTNRDRSLRTESNRLGQAYEARLPPKIAAVPSRGVGPRHGASKAPARPPGRRCGAPAKSRTWTTSFVGSRSDPPRQGQVMAPSRGVEPRQTSFGGLRQDPPGRGQRGASAGSRTLPRRLEGGSRGRPVGGVESPSGIGPN